MALGIFAILFLISHVEYKVTFVIVVIVASILPDIDSGFSKIGKSRIFFLLQKLTKHRGFIHSFTFCVAVSVVLALYLPKLALPFFVGYGLHLFADALTIEGIRPFWPLKHMSTGKIRVGGASEQAVFATLCIVDVLMFVFLFL